MTELTLLAGDIAFGESPRWHDGRIWLSDWAAQEILAVDLDGKREVMARVASFPFCFDRLPDGTLVVVSAADRALLRQEPGGALTPYADLSTVAAGPWNEIVVDGRGNAYVNEIGFDFPGGEFAPGRVALVTPDGEVRQVTGDLAFPNGMAVTPDGSTLIVAESYAARLTAFDIGADGGLSGRRVWADLGEGAAPDGICLDAEGAVWFAEVPGRRCVRVAEGGEVLATHRADRGCFACMLGGPEGTTLFVVAAAWPPPEDGGRTGRVLTVEAPAPAAGWPVSS
jgi:sugar lactone lactonase YvrE